MRRLREHGEAGGGGRIADGVAPIVERRRRQLVRHAQFEVLGDFVDLDVRLDADIAPHADDRLDHFVILGLEAARRLDGELDRLVFRIAAGGKELGGHRRVIGDLDGRIERGVFRRFQRRDRHAIAAQQLLDDGVLVDRVRHGETDVLVVHHAAVGDEDHADVRDRRAHALQAGLGLEPVVLLVRHLKRDIRRTAFDFGDAAGRIRHELEDDGLERRLAAPVFRIGLEPQIGVALIGIDHVRAGADRLFLEALRPDFLEIGFRQHVAGEERHPLEQHRIVLLDVGGDLLAVDLEVVDAGPDERYRVAAVRLALALDRPHHVFGRQRRTVMPNDAFAHVHPNLALVVVPAPAGEQAGLEREVRLLADILIEDRPVDRLDGRVDRGRPGLRIERRQVDVVGDVERGADGGAGKARRRQQRAEETAARREGLTTREIEHVLQLPHLTAAGGNCFARRHALSCASDCIHKQSTCIAARHLDRDTLNLKQTADKLTHWAF